MIWSERIRPVGCLLAQSPEMSLKNPKLKKGKKKLQNKQILTGEWFIMFYFSVFDVNFICLKFLKSEAEAIKEKL